MLAAAAAASTAAAAAVCRGFSSKDYVDVLLLFNSGTVPEAT